jgi:hypothetical protein
MGGATAKAIQVLMCHADLSMTQQRSHLSPATTEPAIQTLRAWIGLIVRPPPRGSRR